MSKKKVISIISICVLTVTALVTAIAAGAFEGIFEPDSKKQQTDVVSADNTETSSPIQQTSAGETEEYSKDLSKMYSSVGYVSFEKATESWSKLMEVDRYGENFTKSQAEELLKYYNEEKKSYELKKMLESVGAIEKDMPMLKLEDARQICKDVDNNNIGIQQEDLSGFEAMKWFSILAGGPDKAVIQWPGVVYTYYLNEKMSEYIKADLTSVMYIRKNLETGEVESEHLFESNRILAEQYAKESEELIRNDPYEGLEIYDYYYKYATEAQRKELEKVKEIDTSHPATSSGGGFYTKKILEIMGKIPKGMPMLTLEQAQEICSDPELISKHKAAMEDYTKTEEFVEALLEEFNAVAGAPDWEDAASPMYLESCYHRYFINERTEYISIIGTSVSYGNFDDDGMLVSSIMLFDYGYEDEE